MAAGAKRKKPKGAKHDPRWHQVLAAALLVLALALPFLPSPGWKFWKPEYISYIMALVGVPVLLLRRETKGSRWIRRIVLLAALALFGFLQWACPRPTGAVELFIVRFLEDKPVLNFGLKLGVLLGIGWLFGRYFCGWICPKGAIQEFLYRPGLAWKIPPKADRILKYGKYVSLAALIVAPLVWRHRLFREIGPFKVIFNLDGGTFLVILLVVVLVASVFIERPWCRYACPIGGLLGLIAALSPTRIRVLDEACTGCTQCAKACPVDAITAPPGKVPVIDHKECLACMECEAACPRTCITLSAAAPTKVEVNES